MADITITAVKKSYGRAEVLHGLDINIADGEFIVIVGPSGCGKSTLLRIIAGLEKVTDGEVAIGGRRVNDLEPMDRNIAMVFQNYALYPHMSVFQNLAYGLKIAKTPGAEIQQRVAQAAQLLQLTALLERKPKDLSGGQRQRVAMGRAIVREPAVFLFDEPLSNLDARLRSQMRLEIKSLQKKLGVTSVYVTHDQVEAMTLADRIVVMNEGVIEQIGRPDEIYNRPQTRFVGGFTGAPPMNFIAPRKLPDAALDLPRHLTQAPDAVAALGIRPEKITLTDAASARLQGTVVFNEPLGAHTIVHVRLESGDTVTALQTAAAPAPGAAIGLDFSPADAHLFDQNGKRIEAE
ncbi:MAG: sn-glycerol-3-phosphate ABC transporter ATP-binding protein UgpC [Gammaproteobacteria bacterium]|nr:sn-glycerol-3-phosphate ABC transporter ATP-binding protein UgpC [Gammaproteobacteria bacterium]